MALEEDRIHIKRIVVVSLLLALSFFLLDITLLLIEGIKFTFILNPNVPTAPLEFVLYILGFAAMGFIVGLIVRTNISDLAIAAQVGPLIFLTINGVALALIVIANPAWALNVLPAFTRYYGGMDPYVALPHILRDFFMQYLLGIVLFEFFVFPLVFATVMVGQAISQLLREGSWRRRPEEADLPMSKDAV